MAARRLRIAVNDFILHLHPPRVPEKALKFTYTYGLGGLSILLLVILISEGLRELLLGGSMVTTIPYLVSLELVFALVVIALMLSWTLTVDAPLLEAANPNHAPDPTKAAWYFMGLQERLLHFHPSIAVVVTPGLLARGLLYLPYAQADPHYDYTGIWFRSRRGRRLALLSTLLGVGITVGLVILGEGGNFASRMPGVNLLLSNGWIPLGVILFALWGYVRLIQRGGATRSETRLALFTLLLTAFSGRQPVSGAGLGADAALGGAGMNDAIHMDVLYE